MTRLNLKLLMILPALCLMAGCETTRTQSDGQTPEREVTIRDRSPTTALYPNGLPFTLQPYPGSP